MYAFNVSQMCACIVFLSPMASMYVQRIAWQWLNEALHVVVYKFSSSYGKQQQNNTTEEEREIKPTKP